MSTAPGAPDRFGAGREVLAQVAGSAGARVLDGLADIAPDLARLTVEFGYGDIYTRPGLSLPQRQVLNVAALTALGTAAPQLRFHIDGALNVGVAPDEIVETIIHTAAYAGFPAALNGLAVARAAFADRPDVAYVPGSRRIGPALTSDQRYECGVAVLRRVAGPDAEGVVESLADIAPDLGRLLVEFAFGDIHARIGLAEKTRELATIAICTALGTAAPQLRWHLHGFLNVGGTRMEAVETIIQMASYAGFPAALNGIALAREVFAERDASADESS